MDLFAAARGALGRLVGGDGLGARGAAAARRPGPRPGRRGLVPLGAAAAAARRARGDARLQLDMELQAQMATHNLDNAKRQVDVMGEGQEGPRKKSPRFRWDQWLPRTMLRAVFSKENLRMAASSVAKVFKGTGIKGSHLFVRQLRSALAELHCDSQRVQIERQVLRAPGTEHNWLVMHLQWDETKFTVQLNDGKPPCGQQVMTQHGVLHWEDEDLRVHSQELIFPPSVLESATADCMLGGLARALRVDMDELWPSALLACLSPSVDSVAANGLVCKYLLQTLPWWVLLLPSFCLQHQTAICLQSVGDMTGVVGGMFSTVRHLQTGANLRALETALRQILSDEEAGLEVRRGAPNPADRGKLDMLLGYCDRQMDEDVEDEEVTAARGQRRGLTKPEVDLIKEMFTGDVSQERPVHHCRGRDCCANRQESVDSAVAAVMVPLRRRLAVPALNRWNTVHPTACVLLLLISLHGLLPRALEKTCGAAVRAMRREDGGLESGSGAAGLGDFRREQHVRTVKMMRFLSDLLARQRLVLWVAVAAVGMRFHYACFKRGSLHGWLDPKGSALSSFCKSVVFDTLAQLSSAFDPAAAGHYDLWRLPLALHGPLASWPGEVLREADAIVHVFTGSFYRRFDIRLSGYPWRLMRLVDASLDMGARRAEGEELFRANECCLDSGFSLRLRKMCTTGVDDLFLPEVQRFLSACFRYAMASTVHSELLALRRSPPAHPETSPRRVGFFHGCGLRP